MVSANAMQVEEIWHPIGIQVMLSSNLRRLFAEMTTRTPNGFNYNVVHQIQR